MASIACSAVARTMGSHSRFVHREQLLAVLIGELSAPTGFR